MRLTVCLLVLSGILLPAMADSSPDSVDFRIETHQWEHRILLVFAPTDTAEALDQQADLFDGQEAGFRERDLLLVRLVADKDGSLRDAPAGEEAPLTEASQRRLYERFDVPEEAYRVILVGKDGTEKRRDVEPVTARSIFDTIDAMPMRQREMRDSSEEERG